MALAKLPVDVSSGSLGVSALLDELLAENPAVGKEITLPSTHESEEQRLKDEARQIAELCGEVDSCLAALDRMEEDNRRQAQAFRRNMEAEQDLSSMQFPTLTTSLDGRADSLGDVFYQVSVSPSRSVAAQLPMPVCHPGSPSPTWLSALAGMNAEEDTMRIADEERIAKLRAEVEGMRIKEAEMQNDIMQQWLDGEAMDETALRAASEVEAVPSEIRSAELSALVAEADSIFGDLDCSMPPRAGAAEVSAIETLEMRLESAQRGLGQIGGALDSELHELEKLLAAEQRNEHDEPDEVAVPF